MLKTIANLILSAGLLISSLFGHVTPQFGDSGSLVPPFTKNSSGDIYPRSGAATKVIVGATSTANSTKLNVSGGETVDNLTVSGTCTGCGAAGGTPGGSNTQLQYNNSGAFGGISGATTNGTALTLASGDLILSGATSGTITLQPVATAGSNTITLPAVTGTATVLGNTTTGSGNIVLATSPTLTTPILGVAAATTINKVTLTAPATGSTLTIADGKTLTANNTLTLTGTDGSSVAFGTGGTVAYTNVTTLSSLASVGTITTGTWNGSLIDLAHGGTNANLTASNGGIFYSTGSAGAILSGTATANQILLSGASAAPTWSTATYPATAGTSGNVLTSNGTNWVSQAPAGGGAGLIVSSGQCGNNSPGATVYFGLLCGISSSTENNIKQPVAAGTASKMYVKLMSAQPGDNTETITLRDNNVDTAITLTITAGSAQNATFSDVTHTATISAGDQLDYKVINNSASGGALFLISIEDSAN